jgi:sulfur relay protein TusB/DsrH
VTVHLVFSKRGLAACSAVRRAQDPVVLLGDGVYAHAAADPEVRILDEDLTIRGIVTHAATTVTYDALLELCAQHTPIVSWND